MPRRARPAKPKRSVARTSPSGTAASPGQLRKRLAEAREQQRASSEILKAISRSTSDLGPVLETLIENATRLCGADRGQIYLADGDVLRYAIAYGLAPDVMRYLEQRPLPITPASMAGRAALARRTIHVPDLLAEPWFQVPDDRLKLLGLRTVLAVPMLRGETVVGVVTIWKTKVQPFTDRQMELVTGFADQALIAIENVRMFQELQSRTGDLARSVEELKALGEVGKAVSSTLDVEAVLSTIVARAAQLSTPSSVIYEYDDASEEFHVRATHRMAPEQFEVLRASPVRLGQGAVGQAAVIGKPVEVPDILDAQAPTAPQVQPILVRLGYRSLLAVRFSPRADHGRPGRLAARGRPLLERDRQPSRSVRHAVRAGHPERAALPRDRRQEPPAGDRQPAQVGVPGQHVARAADPAQRRLGILGSPSGPDVRRGQRQAR
jgi:GAF domain-containing protein